MLLFLIINLRYFLIFYIIFYWVDILLFGMNRILEVWVLLQVEGMVYLLCVYNATFISQSIFDVSTRVLQLIGDNSIVCIGQAVYCIQCMENVLSVGY